MKILRSDVRELFRFPMDISSGFRSPLAPTRLRNVRDTAAATIVRELGRLGFVVNELVLHTRRFTGRSRYEHNNKNKKKHTDATTAPPTSAAEPFRSVLRAKRPVEFRFGLRAETQLSVLFFRSLTWFFFSGLFTLSHSPPRRAAPGHPIV